MTAFLHTVPHLVEKSLEFIKYPLTWLAGLVMFVCNALTGGRLIIYTVVIASVIDLVCGIAVSLKRKRFTLSELVRQTVEKLVVYGLALIVFLVIDALISEGTGFEVALTGGVVGIVITFAETWSFLAALLILYPKNPLLKLLQKALTGEIARKLDIDESEVAKILARSQRPRDAKGRFIKK